VSYLTDEIRKQVALIQTCCYNIEQMAKQAFESALYKTDNPNTDENVVLLSQIGNIDMLCKSVKIRCDEMEICLGVAEDMEKEASGGNSRQDTAPRLL
jgi:hypothetical protein